MQPSAWPQASSSRLSASPPSASPLPSTSPVHSLLQRSNSSSTLASISPEPTPLGPLTPPEYAYSMSEFPSLSIPLDYYDSPPSPPTSLQDQMQVAYAFENMHLAKVLLLKLNGIDVSGDDDPRIAAVTDEDFHSSFVPSGSLPLDEADQRRCREGERRDRERRRRKQRDERLKACERLWEGSTQWVRDERAKVARRREEEARQRRRAEIGARERAKERDTREREQELLRQARVLRVGNPNQRPLLCYDSLADTRSPPPQTENELFQFTLMPILPRRASSSSCSISPPDKDALSLPRMRRELALQHAQSLAHCVPFSQVVASMHGPLFPEDTRPQIQPRRSAEQMDLLEGLFKVVEWEEQERIQVKGKAREASRPSTTRSESACMACSLGSASTCTTSTSATTITRSNSWFSFGSRGSVSTTHTTPSTSPLSPVKLPARLPPLTPFLIHDEPLPLPLRHSCRLPPRATIPTSEHPLSLPTPPVRPQKHTNPPADTRGRPLTRGARSPSSDADADTGLVRRVSRSVSSLMDLAAQLQRAYVRATLMPMGGDARSRSPSQSRSASPPRRSTLRPAGYRARPAHVQLFIAAPAAPRAEPAPTRTLIPLGAPAAPPPRVFVLPAPPPRSPFRVPGAARAPRLRPVANPVLLRLQALQNVCAARALVWEGRGREGRMCAGREKMLGVAWEGIGRSGLGWGVSAVCSC